jgi:hypothetical protein
MDTDITDAIDRVMMDRDRGSNFRYPWQARGMSRMN